MKRTTILSAVFLLLFAMAAVPALAQSETSVTVGAGGIFPAGATFNGLPVNGLQAGYGVIITGTSAIGQFCTILLGSTALGVAQTVTIEGVATAGSRTAPNVATFSGTCTVNMGNGTLPSTGVPFTATVTTDANSQGSLGLVIGLNNLPNATINSGTMKIK